MSTSAIQERARNTWEQFCDDLKQAGSQLIRDDLPTDELDAAEGLRYLSRLVRTGLERNIEGADPANPHLYVLCDERIKGFGGDNPDTRYFGATISSEYKYRLTGDFRDCTYFTIMTNGKDEHGTYTTTGSLDGASMPDAKNSPIEIEIHNRGASHDSSAIHTLSTTRDTTSLLVRCTFDDAPETDGLDLSLSRVGTSGRAIECRLDPIANGLTNTAKFVHDTARLWCNQSAGLRKNFNQLPLQDPERIRKMGGDPTIFYYSAAWSLAPNESLVIHIPTIPTCSAWVFQINNIWTESLDYTQDRIHLNKATAHYEEDGSVTMIVSEQDPGHPNWLRTQGHRSGTANLRLMGANEPLIAQTRVVEIAEANKATRA